jgi:SAM-dependent methyltransferase
VSNAIEYRGLLATTWDLLRGDTSAWPDRPFYKTLIERREGPALDVGCGTGRLLLEYLASGLDVYGVDESAAMLDICRAKAAGMRLNVENRLFEQEMARLSLGQRYAVIFVPSSSFQLLTDAQDAKEAMARFYKHLLPDGIFVMSIMSKLWKGNTPPVQMQWSEWRKVAEGVRREDGATIRRSMRMRYDHEQQLEHEEDRFEVLRDNQIIQSEICSRAPATRWYTQAQAIACCERAGFTAVTATSRFTLGPASPADTLFCVIGTRL